MGNAHSNGPAPRFQLEEVQEPLELGVGKKYFVKQPIVGSPYEKEFHGSRGQYEKRTVHPVLLGKGEVVEIMEMFSQKGNTSATAPADHKVYSDDEDGYRVVVKGSGKTVELPRRLLRKSVSLGHEEIFMLHDGYGTEVTVQLEMPTEGAVAQVIKAVRGSLTDAEIAERARSLRGSEVNVDKMIFGERGVAEIRGQLSLLHIPGLSIQVKTNRPDRNGGGGH